MTDTPSLIAQFRAENGQASPTEPAPPAPTPTPAPPPALPPPSVPEVRWALLSDGGRVVAQVVLPEGTQPAPRHASGQRFATAVRTARQADLALETVDPATGEITEIPAAVEAQLIALIKLEAERRKMLLASPGGYKKAEYAAKEREVAAWDALGTTPDAILAAFGLLPAVQRATRFAYAMAAVDRFGGTPAAAIARFRAGITRSALIPRLAAEEEHACLAIRAATTVAAKRAAYAAVLWPS